MIGRDEAMPIQMRDTHVSRRHLRIRFDDYSGSYSITDMGSKNGVLVNGVKIHKEVKLTPDDRITIGNTTLVFTLKDFFDRECTLAHIRKLGEQEHPTQADSAG